MLSMRLRWFVLSLCIIAIAIVAQAPVVPAHRAAAAAANPRPKLVQGGDVAPTLQQLQSEEVPQTDPGQGEISPEVLPTYPQIDQNTTFTALRKKTAGSRSGIRPIVVPGRNRKLRPRIVSTGATNVTGINHWWTYEEGSLPGVGRYMLNVASGNLLIQEDDMDVPNKGIDLAFRRTYNSASRHDYANSDGSVVNNYGDGWTNTFDAHIAVNDAGGISLYDIDGARYDYNYDAVHNVYVAPAGQYAILIKDASNNFEWEKKSGTVYLFKDVTDLTAKAGRLLEIWGRNHNCKLTFSYSFDLNMPQTADHLNQILVTAEDGRAATLHFDNTSTTNPSNRRLLAYLLWPDNTKIWYKYDANGNLVEVDEASNTSNAGATRPHGYSYPVGNHLIGSVGSPRWVVNGSDGGWIGFQYQPGGPAYAINDVTYNGWINPTVGDGYSTGPLQSGLAANYGVNAPYRTVTLSLSSGSTTWSDTDGHKSVYSVDSGGRVTQTKSYTSATALLTTSATWDTAHNLLTAETDPRGNETDYAYDANGNTTAVGEPSVNVSVDGSLVTMRPTSRYTYDANNNLLAYCDPYYVHKNLSDWPASASCPTGTLGTTQYTWTIPAGGIEPFGELTKATTPLGYNMAFSYGLSGQGGTDYGLPTLVAGDNFNQNDGSALSPQQSFVYDAHGNLVCYSKATGYWWILQYDAVGRMTAAADPDDTSVTNANCTKTLTLTSSPSPHTVTTKTYFANGQLATSQSPSEYAAGVTSSFSYDLDGDQASETRNFGGAASPSAKWYDGDDRLVEVRQPYDSRTFDDGKPYDYYSHPWLTRYYYDLSAGATVSIASTTGIKAYGNLYKTQEYVAPAPSAAPGWTGPTPIQWRARV